MTHSIPSRRLGNLDWHFLLLVALAITFAPPALFADDTPAPAPLPPEITGSGTVIDADTGQPVAGAKITIWEYEPAFESGLPTATSYFRHHECISHGDGKFEFTLPTDHAMKPADGRVLIRLELEVKHPHYVLAYSPLIEHAQLEVTAPPALAAARKQTGSDQPVRQLPPIRLTAAKSVTGILQSSDGKPAPGVRVYASSSALLKVPTGARGIASNVPERTTTRPEDFQDDTATDNQGRFELLVPAAGETILSIWPAKDYAPSSQYIADQRGDVGTITLKQGRTLVGRVLDAQDKPLAGVHVYAQVRPDPTLALAARKGEGASSAAHPVRVVTDASTPALVQQHASIWRATTTDAQGKFAFAPLPPGEYIIELRDAASDLTTEHRRDPWGPRHPLPAYFAPQKIVLSEDQEPQPLEIQPSSTVSVSGRASIPEGLLDALRQIDARRQELAGGGSGASVAVATEGADASQAAVNQRLVPSIRGQVNGFDFYAKAQMEADGSFKFTVPRGLRDGVLRLNPLTAIAPASRVSAAAAAARSTPPKWRIGKDKPLVGGTEIPLGNVDADIPDIEIVYPDSPKSEPAPAAPRAPRGAAAGS